MTLEKYKKKRRQLEDTLLELINEFEGETGAYVERVRLDHQKFADGQTRTSSLRVQDKI